MKQVVHIYAIGRAEGPIKIGISANPISRVSELQSGCPFRISLLYSQPCRDRVHALSHEQTIHEVYKADRLQGEWFDIDEDTAIEAIDVSFDTEAHFEGRCGCNT